MQEDQGEQQNALYEALEYEEVQHMKSKTKTMAFIVVMAWKTHYMIAL